MGPILPLGGMVNAAKQRYVEAGHAQHALVTDPHIAKWGEYFMN